MLKRLKNIEEKILSIFKPEIVVILVEEFRGETREQAIKRYCKENKLKSVRAESCAFITLPNDEQIRQRIKKLNENE